jgi:hypothetical protein
MLVSIFQTERAAPGSSAVSFAVDGAPCAYPSSPEILGNGG